MHLKIEKEKVKGIDLTELTQYPIVDGVDFSEAGIEAYKFYAYLSTLVEGKNIIEVGTRYGKSAVALAFNPLNHVTSYDILEQGASNIQRDNLTFRIHDFMEDESIVWNNVDIIMIDVDPHDGIKERVFMEFLQSKNWEGLLVLDDILPNWPSTVPGANPQEMNNWWNSIEEEKYDVSDVAHFSGTGIVNIGNRFTIEVC